MSTNRTQAPGAITSAVVDNGTRRRHVSLGVIGLLILGLTLGALGHVAVHAKRLEVALALGQEESIYRELAEQRRRLEIEIGKLKDPGRVKGLAHDKLHMAAPAPDDIRSLAKQRKGAGK